MQLYSTQEVVSVLVGEGHRLTRSRLEALLATGQVSPPQVKGTSRVWTGDDVAHVRRVLENLDGKPATRKGGEDAL